MISLIPFLSTYCIAISALLVAVGWYLIKKEKKEAHRKTMIAAAAFAVLFLLTYITRTIIVGNTAFGGPEQIKPYYIMFLLFHIFLAITGVTLGVITITYARKSKYKQHKKMGRWAAIIWFFSALTGITVYFLLYIIWEPGDMTNMWRAILG